MNKIISKLVIGRLSLMSFIILCSMFTIENAFSMDWDNLFTKVTYEKNPNSIKFTFMFHQYCDPGNHGYLDSCDFSYSENGHTYNKLISVFTEDQKDSDKVKMVIKNIKVGEDIKYVTMDNSRNWINLPDNKCIRLLLNTTKYLIGNGVTNKSAYISLLWDVTQTSTRVKFFKMSGLWFADNKSQGDIIEKVYELDNIKSNTNTMENTPLELNSKIVNEVKVTGGTDAINVTGTEPGEKIKVYSVSGVEVKSVIAADDFVNIKLPTNQIYIVKAGQTHYKAAL